MRNWMFFGSLEAGSNNALFYTVLANCRVHDLDPEMYLTEVITRTANSGLWSTHRRTFGPQSWGYSASNKPSGFEQALSFSEDFGC